MKLKFLVLLFVLLVLLGRLCDMYVVCDIFEFKFLQIFVVFK